MISMGKKNPFTFFRKSGDSPYTLKTVLKGDTRGRHIRRLRSWQEIVGTVECVAYINESIVINILTNRRISLEIPHKDLMDCDLSLKQLTGRRISILKTDYGYYFDTNNQTDDSQSMVPKRMVNDGA